MGNAPGGDTPAACGQSRIPGTSVTDLIGDSSAAELFALILTAGPISRGELAHRSGLSPSAVTRLLAPLIEAGFLREMPGVAAGRGRPHRLLEVDVEQHVVVGIKIAPGHVFGVLTDLGAQVLTRIDAPLQEPTPAAALDCAGQLVARLLAEVPNAEYRTLGVGVGVSGHVAKGICRYSALLDWVDVDVAGPIAEATGLPVAVENDVNALVVAERWFGAGRDVESFAVVTVGAGVGCGLLLDGRLYSGISGIAGELGHLPIDPDGPLCSCGNRGCLESVASSAAVLAVLRASGYLDGGDIEDARFLAHNESGAAGDAARSAFAAAGEALGRALAGLCNLLNLQKIILAGEGAVAYELFGPAMSVAFDRHAFSVAARDCAVELDPVTDDLWARGAACLVIRETVRAPLS